MRTVVIDTNIFISAVMNHTGAQREVLRLALTSQIKPVMGNALFLEYEDVLSRSVLFEKSPISAQERESLFNALMSVCRWISIYYLWRPNLRDEADNHIIELAIAAKADTVITENKRDFRGGDLRFPHLEIQTTKEFLDSRSKT